MTQDAPLLSTQYLTLIDAHQSGEQTVALILQLPIAYFITRPLCFLLSSQLCTQLVRRPKAVISNAFVYFSELLIVNAWRVRFNKNM